MYLEEAVARGCRTIERAMVDKGVRAELHMYSSSIHLDPNHPNQSTIEIMLVGSYEDEPASVSVVDGEASISASDRAGVRALLHKLEQAIETATAIAEGGEMTLAFQEVINKAEILRPGDIAANLVQKVMGLRHDYVQAHDEALQVREKLQRAQDPDKRLQDRLKAKMKATYISKREMLEQFCAFLIAYEEAHPNITVDVNPVGRVDDFLEQIGGDDV